MITVKINTQPRHRCDGCKWLKYPSWREPGMEPYCSNSKSIWYLRTTSVGCSKKEWKDDDEGSTEELSGH